jgi:hypothetical protein
VLYGPTSGDNPVENHKARRFGLIFGPAKKYAARRNLTRRSANSVSPNLLKNNDFEGAPQKI